MLGLFDMKSLKENFRFLRSLMSSDEEFVRRQYRYALGRDLDLDDPKGFHEKICWLRLNRFTPLHTYCTDKITAAAYVYSRVGPGYTVPRHFFTTDVGLLSAKSIPVETCVIKPNHASQTVAIIDNTSSADWHKTRLQMAESLKQNYYWYARERQYRYINPALIIEDRIDMTGVFPGEVNMYCLDGRVAFSLVFESGAIVAKKPGVLLDRNFKPLQVTRQKNPIAAGNPPRPMELSRMIEIAEVLAEPFPLVRVDFLRGRSGFYVNELTFSPVAGYDRFIPETFEVEMGSRITHNAPMSDWRSILLAAKACEAKALPVRR
jgi:hypothetical protein